MNQTNKSIPAIHQQRPRIVFMGSPEFAVASLDALLQAGFHIVAVITAPDRPAGRGMQTAMTAVKRYAMEKNIPVLQPEKLRNPDFLQELKSLEADLQVVVAFRMLPESVWNMPPLGTINLHASLLPQYRGAAPINWAIIRGEKETGLTTFKLRQEIDTGNILLQEKLSIGPRETAGSLHDRMKEAGAQLLVKTVHGILDGSLHEIPQPTQGAGLHQTLYAAPKIHTETAKIDWNKPSQEIYNLIRGLSPVPGAFTTLEARVFKILEAAPETIPTTLAPGAMDTDGKTYLKFACRDGFITCLEVQLQGKKKMPIQEFLRGYRFSTGPSATG